MALPVLFQFIAAARYQSNDTRAVDASELGIPYRLRRHFFVVNLDNISQSTVETIFASILGARFGTCDDGDGVYTGGILSTVAGMVVRASMKVLTWASATLLPTPSHPHYQFTLSDIARVVQGVLRVPKAAANSDANLLQVWKHELMREFSDKLVSEPEREELYNVFCTACTESFVFPKPSAPSATSNPAAAAPAAAQQPPTSARERKSARGDSDKKRAGSPAVTPRRPTGASAAVAGASPRTLRKKQVWFCAWPFRLLYPRAQSTTHLP